MNILGNPDMRGEVKRKRKYRPRPGDYIKYHSWWVAYREKNKEILNLRSRLIMYGMTIAQFRSAKKKQKGCCAICKRNKKRLCVDHNHVTKQIRALLCYRCNIAVGYYENQPLQRLIAKYLKRYDKRKVNS